MEYSIEKVVGYCLFCYLVKPDGVGDDAFVVDGFRNWKKTERIGTHIGGMSSAHNQAKKKCEALMYEKEQIATVFAKHLGQNDKEYRKRLNTSLGIIRFLLRQGLAFQGHDESEKSSN